MYAPDTRRPDFSRLSSTQCQRLAYLFVGRKLQSKRALSGHGGQGVSMSIRYADKDVVHPDGTSLVSKLSNSSTRVNGNANISGT